MFDFVKGIVKPVQNQFDKLRPALPYIILIGAGAAAYGIEERAIWPWFIAVGLWGLCYYIWKRG